MLLFVRSLFWTVLVPGTVTIVIPYLIVGRGSSIDLSNWDPIQLAGLILFIPGVAILLNCIWSFAASGRGTLSPLDAPKRLVVDGLYRYVRNPMYLGVLLILLGETLWFESRDLAGYTAAWFLLVNLIVLLYEEPNLRARFGESYDRYCRVVRRWLPGRPFGSDV